MKRQGTQAPATITVHVPLQFSVRGGRKQIIGAATSAPRSQIDAVVKALARAHRWRKLIESGEFASITELARAEKVNQSYACRMLRLTLLSPPTVNAILDGNLDPPPTLNVLMKPVPIIWDEQQRFLRTNAAPPAARRQPVARVVK